MSLGDGKGEGRDLRQTGAVPENTGVAEAPSLSLTQELGHPHVRA